MAVTHATALRTDLANLATGTATTFAAGSSQKLVVYSATDIAGTVAVTNGSPTVTGTSTTFTALAVGQQLGLRSQPGIIYTILSIGSNTSLTLSANYSGTTNASTTLAAIPVNAAAALTGCTAIATVTVLVWGAGASGVATLSSSTADPGAVGGIGLFYRRTTSGGVAIEQGTFGTSGTDMTTSSTTIAAGATVTVTSGSYTASL